MRNIKAKGTDGKFVKICKQFADDQVDSIAYSNAVKYLIIGINFVLRLILINICKYMAKTTESEQTELITNAVFVCQFFNTAVLLLIVNANLKPQEIPILSSVFQGNLSDFDSDWFNDIGNTLVGAMIFNIYFPVAEFLGFWAMRTTFRFLDRGCGCDVKKTKKTTIQQYMDLYMGPVYLIHFKYSSMLNITFVTFMYGFGMPILFPIAAISFFTLYIVEKFMVYWSYRQPPMYDAVLNNSVLDKMSWAPFLYYTFGYWMLTNPTLLGNNPVSVEKINGEQLTDHLWGSFFSLSENLSSNNLAMPLYIMAILFLVFNFFRNSVWKVIAFVIPVLKIGNFHMDENLPNYYTALDE